MTWYGTTTGESICPGIERLQGSLSALGWNDSGGVNVAWDRTTPGKSFCPWMEQLQGNPSVLE